MMTNKIGQYACPKCGLIEIDNEQVKKIVLYYPKGLSNPTAKLRCFVCNDHLTCELTWHDAHIFDYAGARVIGFSFAHGKKFTERDVNRWMFHFDDNMEGFLDEIDRENSEGE